MLEYMSNPARPEDYYSKTLCITKQIFKSQERINVF